MNKREREASMGNKETSAKRNETTQAQIDELRAYLAALDGNMVVVVDNLVAGVAANRTHSRSTARAQSCDHARHWIFRRDELPRHASSSLHRSCQYRHRGDRRGGSAEALQNDGGEDRRFFRGGRRRDPAYQRREGRRLCDFQALAVAAGIEINARSRGGERSAARPGVARLRFGSPFAWRYDLFLFLGAIKISSRLSQQYS